MLLFILSLELKGKWANFDHHASLRITWNFSLFFHRSYNLEIFRHSSQFFFPTVLVSCYAYPRLRTVRAPLLVGISACISMAMNIHVENHAITNHSTRISMVPRIMRHEYSWAWMIWQGYSCLYGYPCGYPYLVGTVRSIRDHRHTL